EIDAVPRVKFLHSLALFPALFSPHLSGPAWISIHQSSSESGPALATQLSFAPNIRGPDLCGLVAIQLETNRQESGRAENRSVFPSAFPLHSNAAMPASKDFAHDPDHADVS